MIQNIIITGIQIAYFVICHRKLWLFSRNISMEHTSELVEIGNLIHNNSYSRKRREIILEGIKIDILDIGRGIIHEVKKSKSLEESHIWQLKYYIYYFKNLGVNIEGIIDYPKLRKREKVSLSSIDISKIEEMLDYIKKIVISSSPPMAINKPYCRKCSYFEFCYS